MKARQAVIFATAFACLASASFGDAPIINQGTFVSPDGRFTLSIAPEINIYGVELPELIIRDRMNGAVERSDPNSGEGDGLNVLTPIFFIKWTGDSKSVLVISHIAHGTIAAVLHFDGSQWHQKVLQPPSPQGGHMTVLSQRLGFHNVAVTYAVDIAVAAQTPTAFYCSSFQFDPATESYSHVLNDRLDHSAYPDREFD